MGSVVGSEEDCARMRRKGCYVNNQFIIPFVSSDSGACQINFYTVSLKGELSVYYTLLTTWHPGTIYATYVKENNLYIFGDVGVLFVNNFNSAEYNFSFLDYSFPDTMGSDTWVLKDVNVPADGIFGFSFTNQANTSIYVGKATSFSKAGSTFKIDAWRSSFQNTATLSDIRVIVSENFIGYAGIDNGVPEIGYKIDGQEDLRVITGNVEYHVMSSIGSINYRTGFISFDASSVISNVQYEAEQIGELQPSQYLKFNNSVVWK